MIECASVRPLVMDNATHRLVDYLTAARLRLQRLRTTGMNADQLSQLGELDRCFDALTAMIAPTTAMETTSGS